VAISQNLQRGGHDSAAINAFVLELFVLSMIAARSGG